MSDLADNLSERLCRKASIGIVITDGQFHVRMINAAAGKLLGVDPAEATGQPVVDLMPEHRRALTGRLLAKTQTMSRPLELRVLHPSREGKRHLSIVVDPIADDAGQVEGICLWVRDQTRRMDLERRLARIDKLAGLGQMAGGLAHHLNNVLGGIVTAVDYGLEAEDVRGAKRALQLVSDGLGNAVKLTRKLLEFASPEVPDQNLVDLTEAVIQFAEQAQPRLAQVGREIDLEIKPIPILAVQEFKMRQILDCLLANSEQAMADRPGKVTITVESDPQRIWLYFQDDGPGIPPDMAEQIFEPFFTTRGPLGGGDEGNLGLGLTLARRLLGEIGGTLSYDPKRGGSGACFVLDFPLRREQSDR